jgi:hypothetical protein
MKRIALYIISLLSGSLVSCNFEIPLPSFDEPAPSTVSIAHLKSLCHSTSDIITDNISIEGYIVANDLLGEYHKAIIVGDDSGCIEILVDYTPTYNHFPISAQARIHCTGLALGISGGKVILGAQPTAEYNIERLSTQLCSQHIKIDKQAPREIEPQQISITDLAPHHIGNYIYLENVTFGSEAGQKWCDTDPTSGKPITTTHTIHDTYGNSLMVRTIAQCAYGNEPIPDGYGLLCGIIEYFDDNYALRIINHSVVF